MCAKYLYLIDGRVSEGVSRAYPSDVGTNPRGPKGTDAKIVRYSSVYGPGRGHGPVNIFINKALHGLHLTVYGDGSQTRDLTYIMDAIRGLKIVLKNGVSGEVYNIGTGVETSVDMVANIVSPYFEGSEILYVDHEFSPYDLKRSVYDISKSGLIGYSPMTPLVEGVELTLQGEVNSV